ncbi:hypothetical protein [Pseudactinotalea sp.]|uniref:hypothetical protein n=1 Tax=Pseudactinotalea sp. TaxID=1926260 RepID=UPI003B3A2A99
MSDVNLDDPATTAEIEWPQMRSYASEVAGLPDKSAVAFADWLNYEWNSWDDEEATVRQVLNGAIEHWCGGRVMPAGAVEDGEDLVVEMRAVVRVRRADWSLAYGTGDSVREVVDDVTSYFNNAISEARVWEEVAGGLEPKTAR